METKQIAEQQLAALAEWKTPDMIVSSCAVTTQNAQNNQSTTLDNFVLGSCS